jgi:hypothetical protein
MEYIALSTSTASEMMWMTNIGHMEPVLRYSSRYPGVITNWAIKKSCDQGMMDSNDGRNGPEYYMDQANEDNSQQHPDHSSQETLPFLRPTSLESIEYVDPEQLLHSCIEGHPDEEGEQDIQLVALVWSPVN